MPDEDGFFTDSEIENLLPQQKTLIGLIRKQQSLQIALEKAGSETEFGSIKRRMDLINARMIAVAEQAVFSEPTEGQVKTIRDRTRALVELNATQQQAEVILGAAMDIFELSLGNGNLAEA